MAKVTLVSDAVLGLFVLLLITPFVYIRIHHSLTTVETLERMVNKSLRKWLGVPPGFSAIGLYSRSSQLQMALSSVVKEFKIEKCRLVTTLRDSKDKKVSEARVQIRTGRKWSASASVSQAESMLTLRDIIGNTCIRRHGLGIDHFHQWEKSGGKIKEIWYCKRSGKEKKIREEANLCN